MPKPAGYNRTQIALHWVIFLLVAMQYLLHEYMLEAWQAIGKGEVLAFSPLVASHVFGGILILLLLIWRIAIKLRRGAPVLPASESRLQQIIAHATHGLLYLMLILMPISGINAWFFGLDLAAQAHSVMRILFLVLILLHFVGALYHWLYLKSGVMQRMFKAA